MPQPPSDVAPIVDADGRLTVVWRAFFAALAGKATASVPVPLDDSPLSYTAPSNGSLMVTGGSVSAITLTRGRDPVPLDASLRAIPLSAGDRVSVTYDTVPTVVFLPQ